MANYEVAYFEMDGKRIGIHAVAPPLSKSEDGLCPKLPNSGGSNKFLNGEAEWATPANTEYDVVSQSADGLCPQLPSEDSTNKFLRSDGEWQIPPDTQYDGATLKTKVTQTGEAQTAIAASIAANTSVDSAVKTLLDNDQTLNQTLVKITIPANTITTDTYGEVVIPSEYRAPNGYVLIEAYCESSYIITNLTGSILSFENYAHSIMQNTTIAYNTHLIYGRIS